jgi:hypothetical protein
MDDSPSAVVLPPCAHSAHLRRRRTLLSVTSYTTKQEFEMIGTASGMISHRYHELTNAAH